MLPMPQRNALRSASTVFPLSSRLGEDFFALPQVEMKGLHDVAFQFVIHAEILCLRCANVRHARADAARPARGDVSRLIAHHAAADAAGPSRARERGAGDRCEAEVVSR